MVSENELQNFAKMVATHEAFPDVVLRIRQTLFNRWLTASTEESREIRDISDNLKLFITEINKIYESIDNDKPINEEE